MLIHKKMTKAAAALAVLAAVFVGSAVSAYAATPAADKTSGQDSEKAVLAQLEASPDWVAELDAAEDAEQLFVVAGIGRTTAYISMHAKDEKGNWKQIMTTPGYIGKNGLGKEKEGDGKTPTGTFRFNYAFGIAEDPGCALTYHQVDEDSYWSGDQRKGYRYNRMVSIKNLPDLNKADSEHIVEYTNEYQYCLNINYNEHGTEGLGSAIFLHCLGAVKPYTGGCVAIPQDKMLTVMRNVDKDCVVIIDSLEVLSPKTWDSMGLAALKETEPKQTAATAAPKTTASAEPKKTTESKVKETTAAVETKKPANAGATAGANAGTNATNAGAKAGAKAAASAGITEAKALEISLAHAGVASNTLTGQHVKTDYEHGRRVYEVKFYVGRMEYDYDIDAETGDVLAFEVDND